MTDGKHNKHLTLFILFDVFFFLQKETFFQLSGILPQEHISIKVELHKGIKNLKYVTLVIN